MRRLLVRLETSERPMKASVYIPRRGTRERDISIKAELEAVQGDRPQGRAPADGELKRKRHRDRVLSIQQMLNAYITVLHGISPKICM